ncbi:hypothetical protein IJM86_06125, partial [bacterium]|nr:hypothetical protein [bacterium]
SLLYALQKGADGDTKNQINQVIDLKPNEETDFLVRYIIKSTKNMTNSLWYKKSLGIQSDYRLFTKDYDFIIKQKLKMKISIIMNLRNMK